MRENVFRVAAVHREFENESTSATGLTASRLHPHWQRQCALSVLRHTNCSRSPTMLRTAARRAARVGNANGIAAGHRRAALMRQRSTLAVPGSTFGSGPQASLVLEDGSRFTGVSFGYEDNVAGELVFNTGMARRACRRTPRAHAGHVAAGHVAVRYRRGHVTARTATMPHARHWRAAMDWRIILIAVF